ncbi:hypothetical protein [Leucothrix pacifica]|uniref:Uncharacterized protein n=1 Tax=Leucothrix pacifica TaxID=1247513 RepID=A0A317CPV6_9GAMM|nr:hypothetical protein [Leucothrix pacifica]PWR00726.1 hypothetical protein DKW60_00515 [Leucothrix pacifica]
MTKKPVSHIAPNLYFDPDVKMFRATTKQAITDLKHCNRNVHMLVESYFHLDPLVSEGID